MTDQEDLAEWFDERYPESIIRLWSDHVVEVAFNGTDMEGDYEISSEELPGQWVIGNVAFSQHGTSFYLEPRPPEPGSDRQLAKWLHEQYEEIAVEVGWETQDGTSVDFEELPEENQEVMLELAARLNETDRKIHVRPDMDPDDPNFKCDDCDQLYTVAHTGADCPHCNSGTIRRYPDPLKNQETPR